MKTKPQLRIGDGAPCTFGESYRRLWSGWNQVRGRASRSEFWNGLLAQLLTHCICGSLIAAMLFVLFLCDERGDPDGKKIIVMMFCLMLIPIFISLRIGLGSWFQLGRRLHDFGASAGFALLIIVCTCVPALNIITTIAMIIIGCIDSSPGTNQYGPSGKYPEFSWDD